MTITRAQFVEPFRRGGSARVADLPDGDVASALRAGGTDLIGNADDADSTFSIIDGFDHDGSRSSITGGTAEAMARALMGEASSSAGPVTGTTPGGIPNTVADCAAAILASPNVSFWTGLSSGSERKTFEDLAAGKQAFVPHTGQRVTPKLSMMQALVAMTQQGRVMINALTGGEHSAGSNHYRGTAVDLDLSTGSTSKIVATANRFGGRRNSETDHIHLDF